MFSRRSFLQASMSAAGSAAWLASASGSVAAAAGTAPQRRFTMDLRCGSIGVGADQAQAIVLARRYGFESVNAEPGFIAALPPARRRELPQQLQEQGLVWGAAGMPVEFRRDEDTFQRDLQALPTIAEALQQAGVTRTGTWLSPQHAQLTYVANFRQHARRLRACAQVLKDHGLRFGMEYVGPKTLWAASRHSFIHTMAETRELIAEIGLDNVGFVLDSWHWYTAHETVEDLKALTNAEIVACDLNDAPRGVDVDQQIDSRRELPTATGVIDLSVFLKTLVEIGYDGPVRAEPFNAALNELDDEAAVAATAKAMQQAFALVD